MTIVQTIILALAILAGVSVNVAAYLAVRRIRTMRRYMADVVAQSQAQARWWAAYRGR